MTAQRDALRAKVTARIFHAKKSSQTGQAGAAVAPPARVEPTPAAAALADVPPGEVEPMPTLAEPVVPPGEVESMPAPATLAEPVVPNTVDDSAGDSAADSAGDHNGSHAKGAVGSTMGGGGGADGSANLANRVGSSGVDTGSYDGDLYTTPPRTTRRGCRSPSRMPSGFAAPTADTIPAGDTEVEKVVGVRPKARPLPTPVRAEDLDGPVLVDDPYYPDPANLVNLVFRVIYFSSSNYFTLSSKYEKK